MGTVKKFESFEEYKRPEITVQDLIDFLQTMKPETKIQLDKDGWEGYGDTNVEIIKTSGIFSKVYNNKDGDWVVLNN
jgi:hypothetical protein